MPSPRRLSRGSASVGLQSALPSALVETLAERRRNMTGGAKVKNCKRNNHNSDVKLGDYEATIDSRCLGLNELDAKIEKSLSHLNDLIAMVTRIERRQSLCEARQSVILPATAPVPLGEDLTPPIAEAVPDEDPPRPKAAEAPDEKSQPKAAESPSAYSPDGELTPSEHSDYNEPPAVSRQVSIISSRKLSVSTPCSELVISSTSDTALIRKITKQGRNMCLEKMWWIANESVVFVRVMRFLILSSVFASLMYSGDPELLVPMVRTGLLISDITFDTIFCLEIFLRFVSCPSKAAFCFNIFNIFDLCAGVLPPIARAIVGFHIPPENGHRLSVRTFLVCCVPTLRIVKLLRSFEAFHLLIRAYRMAIEALPVLLFTLSILVLFFSFLIYVIEPPSNIGHFGRAIWLTVVTTITVGYGDAVPTTFFGYIITTCLTIVSALYMAIPIGIVGNAFSTVWKDRERILLTQRVRDRLSTKGYAASDVPSLFHAFDLDYDGQLNMKEFTDMFKALDIGFHDQHIKDTFLIFDDDYSGAIDNGEFMRYVFPEAYVEIYYGAQKPGMQPTSSESSDSSVDAQSL